MIADKFVDLYARKSGLHDKLIAERDVVLTYAPRPRRRRRDEPGGGYCNASSAVAARTA